MDYIPPEAQPLSTEEARRFYLRSLPLPSLSCTPLYINPLRTSTSSATRPAASTMDFVRDENTGLKKLWYCETMWTRLHAYVSLLVSFEHKNDPAIREPLFHLSECPNAPEFPPSSYEDGYRQMHAIEAIQSIRPQPVVCNIEGVQDAVNSQILDLINAALQMRYENKADKLSPGAKYINSANGEAPVEDVKASCFYPAWLRSCYQNHISKHSGTAGFTDRMLFVSPGGLDSTHPKRTQVALQEGKTPWVYTTAAYQDILRGFESIITDEGTFDVVENGHNGNLLLKQLWGECADLGPDAGFTTNGDVVMVFFRLVPRSQKPDDDARGSRSKTPQSTPDPDSGFILSPLMKWNDTRLRACLLALSFMTLDEESWMSRKVNPISLRDLLCPESECRQILQT
ncbi:hypothetical protein EV421DRAFT_1770322 [Armillaria borealis]|uniref:Uncharacterized protein n=1 Tax=Armillaria borealis TaxID=47425 RepID=A0AA39K3S5_9AGAR|nr:hypothetical protein EV421DRAFT_1770322 [Armillaria borealis]